MTAVVACAIGVGMALPASASAQRAAIGTTGWIVCAEDATISIEPGITFLPQPARFRGDDRLRDCRSSDPTINGGTARIRGASAAASCGFSPLDGIAAVRWDNGKSSRIVFSGAIVAGSAAARGTVVDGLFKGQPFLALDRPPAPDPAVPAACLGPGLTSAAITGYISIGQPLVRATVRLGGGG